MNNFTNSVINSTQSEWRIEINQKIGPMTLLTLAVPVLDKASKGFMKALKAFIKPFEAPQRSVKIKI